MHGFTCEPIVEPAVATPEASAPPKPARWLGKLDPGSLRPAPTPSTAIKQDGVRVGGVAPQAPTSKPPTQPAQQLATAKNDVDIYDGPGGEFDVVGMMDGGSAAPVLAHQEGWYKLQLNVPGGAGWVAEDHLTVKP
jgi:hypothetical protein